MYCCKSLQRTHRHTHARTHALTRARNHTHTTHEPASNWAVFDGEAVLMVACGFSLASLTAVVTEGGGVSPLGEGRTGSLGTRLHLWARGGRAAGCRLSRAGRRSRSPTRRGRRPRPRRRCGIRRLAITLDCQHPQSSAASLNQSLITRRPWNSGRAPRSATVLTEAAVTGGVRSLANARPVRFASTKILVQTQWEAVRFDRVKHTA